MYIYNKIWIILICDSLIEGGERTLSFCGSTEVTEGGWVRQNTTVSFIHSLSILSYDRSKASAKMI